MERCQASEQDTKSCIPPVKWSAVKLVSKTLSLVTPGAMEGCQASEQYTKSCIPRCNGGLSSYSEQDTKFCIPPVQWRAVKLVSKTLSLVTPGAMEACQASEQDTKSCIPWCNGGLSS